MWSSLRKTIYFPGGLKVASFEALVWKVVEWFRWVIVCLTGRLSVFLEGGSMFVVWGGPSRPCGNKVLSILVSSLIRWWL